MLFVSVLFLFVLLFEFDSGETVSLPPFVDQILRVYDTTSSPWKEIRQIGARDVGWSIIDTDFSPDSVRLQTISLPRHTIIFSVSFVTLLMSVFLLCVCVCVRGGRGGLCIRPEQLRAFVQRDRHARRTRGSRFAVRFDSLRALCFIF